MRTFGTSVRCMCWANNTHIWRPRSCLRSVYMVYDFIFARKKRCECGLSVLCVRVRCHAFGIHNHIAKNKITRSVKTVIFDELYIVARNIEFECVLAHLLRSATLRSTSTLSCDADCNCRMCVCMCAQNDESLLPEFNVCCTLQHLLIDDSAAAATTTTTLEVSIPCKLRAHDDDDDEGDSRRRLHGMMMCSREVHAPCSRRRRRRCGCKKPKFPGESAS